MARPYVMVKEIKGIEYAYLYRNVRMDDGQVKTTIVRYLGRLDLLVEALNSVLLNRGEKPLPRRRRKKK